MIELSSLELETFMSINPLPADLVEFVQREIAIGNYNSPDEVICDSLRLLRAQQGQRDELRKELQPAIDRLDRGEGVVVKEAEIRNYIEGLFSEATANLHK
jgi:putative addiction module CopG family antidote